MKNYIKHDEWKVIEEGFNPEYNRVSESLFSIGNGRFGQRANFEETYTGDSLQGNYVAGVYYPDKTRVGWWKIGYPEYFAKVLNAPDWMGLTIYVNDELVDLAKWKILEFQRVLEMKSGILSRKATIENTLGNRLSISSQRFCSMADDEVAAIRYTISPVNFDAEVSIESFVDGTVVNEDSNFDETFWDEVSQASDDQFTVVTVKTLKTDYIVSTGIKSVVKSGERNVDLVVTESKAKFASASFQVSVSSGKSCVIEKFASIVSSLNYDELKIEEACRNAVERASKSGFDNLYTEHQKSWEQKWNDSDITIHGDVAAQQGIRFNIFQLNQTYTGEDPRLNIGPKGFTGEKYGGSTYWDTEAYCLPFYLCTSEENVAENLLHYRYNQLGKAIENAEKLGFVNGAALFPMVTMNGEESHNEWEITFEEIHRNGAIAFAIYDFTRHTGNINYLKNHGLEVLIAISRFWSQRVNWSKEKEQYVLLGVTGPNEFENNVNNNWYTNTIASWTLSYTIESIRKIADLDPGYIQDLFKFLSFSDAEVTKWEEIIDKMYFPFDEDRGVYLQQDGFLDKEIIPVTEIDSEELPINQHWSWDRILRSCYIKQADVLQGLYFFEDQFDIDVIKRNFDFYEPITVHESSLSPCVHTILASCLGYKEKAYEMYLRTARLDLDDYNNDTNDGCHITSMAGTWLAFTKGFAGLRVKNENICFSPYIPNNWDGYKFRITFRGSHLEIDVNTQNIIVRNLSDSDCGIVMYDNEFVIRQNSEESFELNMQFNHEAM